jgi:hypothetical protein
MIRGIGKISTSSHNGGVQPQTQQEREWWAEFDAAAKRPLVERWKYAFIKTYKPVMDDAPIVPLTPCNNIASGARKICPIGSAMAAFEYKQAEEI